MRLQITLIILSTIVGLAYIYFCYRRFKQQKIIEGGIPNNKLRMFWIGICILIGLTLWGILSGVYALLKPQVENTVITIQSNTGTNMQDNGNEGKKFLGSGAILPGGAEDTGEIVSRTTIREKLKHVPVSEVNGVPTGAK